MKSKSEKVTNIKTYMVPNVKDKQRDERYEKLFP